MTSIQGHFDGSRVVLDEPAPLALKVGQKVLIVIEPKIEPTGSLPLSGFGFARGMFEMRDEFNDPLDDFAEYR